MTPADFLYPLLSYCADLPGFSPDAVEVAETEYAIRVLLADVDRTRTELLAAYLALIRVARLNPEAGEIGAGMLRTIVAEARAIVGENP